MKQKLAYASLAALICFFLAFALRAQEGSLADDHLISDGIKRTFLVHWPHGKQKVTGLPVVLVLHGGGGNAEGMARISRFNQGADRAGFLVVYPNGTGRLSERFLTWNSGNCCGYALQNKIDDVAFLDALIEKLKVDYRIDASRIYVTGLSNGAMMTYRLGCELSEKLAGIAPVAGAMNIDCHPTRPLPMMIVHGKEDRHVPYSGGISRRQVPRLLRTDQSVLSAVSFWVKANGCSSSATIERDGSVIRETYRDCKENSDVAVYMLEHEGHTWPGGVKWAPWADPPSREFSATNTMLRFFRNSKS